MFSKLYKFSKFVMYLNSCSMDLGRDSRHLFDDNQRNDLSWFEPVYFFLKA